MWCVAELDEEYIERMEDVLATYELPLSYKEPVVCLDEKPIQLLTHRLQRFRFESSNRLSSKTYPTLMPCMTACA